MKELTMKIGAFMLILSILLSFTVITSTAAATEPTKYSSSSNSGERDVVCTSLSGTSASSYYTGSYTYDVLSEQSESQLYASLQELMSDTHDYESSYDNCRDYATKTDCENNNGRVLLLYSSYSATRSDYISGSTGWNREHVWPKSLGAGSESGGGADLHHIRPDDNKTNSTRSSLQFGNVDGGKVATGSSTIGNLTGGTYNSSFFEPHDNVKGDVARICLYVYVRWGSSWGAYNITQVFQSVDVLLEWCELDPVDTWEMGRNEVVESIQGNRNVFIDYPEYAWLLFGEEIPAGMQTPSGKAISEGTGTGSGTGSDSTGGGETVDPSCQHTNTEIKNAKTATCSVAGYTGDKYCKDCGGKLASGTSIDKLPHSESDWIIDKEATATENGSRHKECTVCHITVKTEVILPSNSVSAFVSAVALMKSSDTMLDRYKYAVLALDAYSNIDEAELASVADTYSELTGLLEGYNSDAESANSAHSKASTVVLVIKVEQISATGCALLPSKENA